VRAREKTEAGSAKWLGAPDLSGHLIRREAEDSVAHRNHVGEVVVALDEGAARSVFTGLIERKLRAGLVGPGASVVGRVSQELHRNVVIVERIQPNALASSLRHCASSHKTIVSKTKKPRRRRRRRRGTDTNAPDTATSFCRSVAPVWLAMVSQILPMSQAGVVQAGSFSWLGTSITPYEAQRPAISSVSSALGSQKLNMCASWRRPRTVLIKLAIVCRRRVSHAEESSRWTGPT
jgi:hypothetical protein